jgi:hypothetical protein
MPDITETDKVWSSNSGRFKFDTSHSYSGVVYNIEKWMPRHCLAWCHLDLQGVFRRVV